VSDDEGGLGEDEYSTDEDTRRDWALEEGRVIP
jgi:hypothetical protein